MFRFCDCKYMKKKWIFKTLYVVNIIKLHKRDIRSMGKSSFFRIFAYDIVYYRPYYKTCFLL